MADTETKNKNMPLIIGGLIVGAIVLYMVVSSKKREAEAAAIAEARARAAQGGGLPVDPCLKPDGTRHSDAVCATLTLLNPLAKVGVEVYKADTALQLEKERLAAQRGY
jgi:hypothetical protein